MHLSSHTELIQSSQTPNQRPSSFTTISVTGFEREIQTIADVVRFRTREKRSNLISEKKISNFYSFIQGTLSVYSHLTTEKMVNHSG